MSVQFTPATRPTFYFIGVSTGSSSIMKVFPAWAEHLGLDAEIKGIDLPIDDSSENYRAVVDFISRDPLSLGSLVTTHKLNLYKASRDLFDRVGSDTEVLDEVSSI
ncbi:MAG: shikimate dehydrogenase, partial [Nakamurella sp.]